MKIRTVSFFTLSVLGMIIFLTFANSSIGRAAGPLPASPREEATVSINFEGLMAICMGNPARVSAGLLDVHHHTPEITIARIKDGERADLAVIRGEQLRRTLYFDVEGSSNHSVSQYYGKSMDDPNDLRWNIDLESDIYQRQLYIQEDKLFGKIHFSAGLFYAGKMTERAVRFFADDNSGKVLPINRRIAAPAAKLNLAMGEALVIRGLENTIRLEAEPGVRYEIEVTNMPPSDMADMNHFLYYFDVLGTKVTSYSPVMASKAAFSHGPVLCEPALFSKSKLN